MIPRANGPAQQTLLLLKEEIDRPLDVVLVVECIEVGVEKEWLLIDGPLPRYVVIQVCQTIADALSMFLEASSCKHTMIQWVSLPSCTVCRRGSCSSPELKLGYALCGSGFPTFVRGVVAAWQQ
jgi:hypothetical protein